ncbi:fused deadenylyltransferase and adenylyltransferase for glutamine synthetase [Psychromonas ingrahamii 37]|uniref:Bifunctional glutamine synthetase adenylyltransferase/adenylyl-removing enzyme n=1 Tax=Psychromonas ingrahamii (strain DSM 17664 / CCUG 51855 / 37) TaxID=357804 RepID=GLNE_PSYIN|nr:bifunctional [glutamate--ammonia ligase]-adenylyl-L-tyrosine phosphorylase/[glutamate--ammonia-ligase] adenylyltransferase [Psychromonas ingrahamii]A1SRE0.1 RecName: Full=Bifunctional glutamine synthetase adenylyltransferase/adenylyl-removing enzyme; AltName: Full=ATP:glutamine synthetase adenylyltransferase; AltName: Full=ATase; Includes: RecName: Full=Glutamine synthetase adenylyl-L-tyrosine phosphorylase; AltName: Full=Adenylyl removase; Short=AR; Short=AT-N; Includes: RecName: Full=Glutamin
MSLLNDAALHHFENLNNRIDLNSLKLSQHTELMKVLGLSDFVAESLIKQPALLTDLLDNELLSLADRKEVITTELESAIAKVKDEVTLHRVLRLFRRKHMVVIAWRELLGKAHLVESLDHISYLADQLILQCMSWLYKKQCVEQGIPMNNEGVRQPFFIFAMGKLGGKELNFSSDIDLIFTYPERGETQGERRRIDNQSFFTKLGQRIIGALHQTTVDGFVYRVDMRLRPFGESGPLITNFASIEDYYQSHGRDWERYAMIKARVMGEEGDYKTTLEALLKPFVYRRYIDFSAIESLRKMKAMISSEVRRKGLKDNIKLGKGGIREIEFVAQAFQLIRGGRRAELQCKGLRETLKVLAEIGEVPKERVQSLLDAYHFLRAVENVLQQIGDKQTQTLPDNELDKLRLITVMGYSNWQDFYSKLNQEMDNVHAEFNWVIGDDEEAHDEADQALSELWALHLSQQEATHLLHEKGLDESLAAHFATALSALKEELKKRPIGPRGQATLDKLMPRMIELICVYPDPVELLNRITQLLLKIISRTAYLELLNENDGALKQLLKLCNESTRVASQLARHPILLDELLDPQQLYKPTQLDNYRTELQLFMLRIPEEDMEQQMEALRQFKQIQFLYIAAADIEKSIQLPQVSDHLTYLSEAIMDYVVQIAWLQMVDKFGLPSNVIGSDRKGFAVIGYGKMGGIELGYGSDLDVVFLHDDNIKGETNGRRKIDNQLFYFRLAQRIIHLFSARTNSGILYEIDMRLRPSGDSGILVSSVASYKKYLQNNAWTWEHQALVRARAVFFDKLILAKFNEARETVLSQARNNSALATEIRDMRAKMRKHLSREKEGQFDLKQSPGGMVDIEFFAQYLVLAHACHCGEELCKWSDNLRIFETCRKLGLLTLDEEKKLTGAYCALRDATHRLTLNKKTRIIKGDQFIQERQNVIKIWEKFLD